MKNYKADKEIVEKFGAVAEYLSGNVILEENDFNLFCYALSFMSEKSLSEMIFKEIENRKN
jgi:hypothetical protein